jgi:hypothetical protein
MASGPQSELIALLISECSDDYHDEIDKHPDAETSQRQNLQYSGSDLTDVEPVYPEKSKQKA